MLLNDIVNSDSPHEAIAGLLDKIHKEGPSDARYLESLSYFKIFHPEVFLNFEEKILSALGLFYKNNYPTTVYSFLMAGFGEQHKKRYGRVLTPVQASIRRAVDDSQFVSISAPTSAGKSYSIRDFIAERSGDAVVVVPSRALIAEYIDTLKERFDGDKSVMITPFVDKVYKNRVLRRIFVITPERSKDLFALVGELSIDVFFFDEAQMSEEKERGVVFDVMVRRVRKRFPLAKIIFAHPFVENPDAQFKKHGISSNDYSMSYRQGAVGKLAIYKHKNGSDYFFSPYLAKGHLQKNCVEFQGNFKDFALNGDHTVLVYVSKASIYNGTFADGFTKYIDEYPEVEDPKANQIIHDIEELIGANSESQISDLVEMLRRGVVIHHGSVPLEVRFLVEDFMRGGYARICFATSTLAQGVNMPFDIVWLENTRVLGEGDLERSLSFKNLIGRSGRLTQERIFDFGYVYTKNPKLFAERLNMKYTLSEVSLIESTDLHGDESIVYGDFEELLHSVKDNTFNEALNLPESKVVRLSALEVLDAIKSILDFIYSKETIVDSIGSENNRKGREEASLNFQCVFEAAVGRGLYEGENAVFNSAISILFLVIQGYSFKQIAGLRYSRVSNRDGGKRGYAEFSQPANKLPDSKLKKSFSLFKQGTLAKSVRFDSIVYDTYDYLDTVISFSLSEVFMAALRIYYEKRSDDRAIKMIELVKYGSNDTVSVLLMRYGFPPEDVSELAKYVESISEDDIQFSKKIEEAPQYIRDIVEWYLP